MIDLGFGLVALLFEPFHKVERIEMLTFLKRSHLAPEIIRMKRSLKESCDIGHDERRAFVRLRIRERDKRLEPIADHISVRQLRFVGQDFPRGIEKCLRFR